MKIYTLKKEQYLPISIDNAWNYFSDPFNLTKITPPELGLKILNLDSQEVTKIYPGMIIQYVVTPVLGIKQKWVTEITHVNPPHYFVDEQRFGPYEFWHHQHHFRIASDDVVKCTDLIHYSIRLDPLSRLINYLVVSKNLKLIFEFRKEVLEKKFGKL